MPGWELAAAVQVRRMLSRPRHFVSPPAAAATAAAIAAATVDVACLDRSQQQPLCQQHHLQLRSGMLRGCLFAAVCAHMQVTHFLFMKAAGSSWCRVTSCTAAQLQRNWWWHSMVDGKRKREQQKQLDSSDGGWDAQVGSDSDRAMPQFEIKRC